MHKYRTDLIDHHHLFVGRRLPMRQNEKSFICFAMRHKPINDNWIILKVHCIDELQVLISYEYWIVVVAQLVEWLLPIAEINGSNPIVIYIYCQQSND